MAMAAVALLLFTLFAPGWQARRANGNGTLGEADAGVAAEAVGRPGEALDSAPTGPRS